MLTCQLAIFDLDGTLLDTLDDLTGSVNAALAACGYAPRTREEVRRFVGNGIGKLVERAVPPGTAAAQVEAVFRAFTAHYELHCAEHTRPYSGVDTLLRQLRAAGVAVAVVSNKADFAVQALCRQYFAGLLDLSVGERPGVPRKPAPDGVNAVLAALGADRGRAVYIGDSEVDVQTARNAGVACIAVRWGFRDEAVLRQAGATTLVDTPGALQRLLLAQ